jgi:hypothetical protein
VLLEPHNLDRHVALFGENAAALRTLAAVLVEGILAMGIPVLVIDGSGWAGRFRSRIETGEAGSLQQDKIEVRFIEPGRTNGATCALPVVPRAPATFRTVDVRAHAESVAACLAPLLGYGDSRTDAKRRIALSGALYAYLQTAGERPSLEGLIDIAASESPPLLDEIGNLGARVMQTLVENLHTFRAVNGSLFAAGSEMLSADLLLRAGPSSEKTRLTVLELGAVGRPMNAQFWLAQLLMEVRRFDPSPPQPSLRAMCFVDQADLHHPAVGESGSKLALENALRQWRGLGLGLVLLSEHAGRFDYRCRENIDS